MYNNHTQEKAAIQNIYRRRAKWYDVTANLYYLIGVREYRYRKMSVAALNLKPGDTVVEIGCGTGINFPLLQAEVGPTGKIIGVDLTDSMLQQARERITREGWSNVEVVQMDAEQYEFPEGIDAVLSTFAISLVPDVGRVIKNAAAALRSRGRFVICDMQMPQNRWSRLILFLLPLVKPFGVSKTHIERRPWETIEHSFRSTLRNIHKTNLYMGFLFLISGEK